MQRFFGFLAEINFLVQLFVGLQQGHGALAHQTLHLLVQIAQFAFGLPFYAQRCCELKNFLTMKRLLQVQEIIGSARPVHKFLRAGTHKTADQYDIRIRIQLLNLFCGPFTIRTRGHAQIQKNDCKGPVEFKGKFYSLDRFIALGAAINFK